MSRPKGSKNKKTLEKEKAASMLKNTVNSTMNSTTKPTANITTNITTNITANIDPSNSSETLTNTVKSHTTKKPVVYPTCSRCHVEILTTPNYLNLSYLTSVAKWHREVANDKVVLCRECALGISDLIDNYLIKGGCETKYPRSTK